MKFELLPGEETIDTWTLIYNPPTGGQYNGKLLVTNKRLLYDAKFDVSAKGFLEEAFLIKTGSEGYLVIPKDKIKSIEPQKSFFAKKVAITLDNGQVHIFNYGMLNIDPVIAAIRK